MSSGEVDILVLGAGWTSQFFVKLFDDEKVSYALSTTTGKINKNCDGKYDGSKIIQFAFQPDPYPRPDDYDENFIEEQYFRLPRAKTVIVTFKLEGKGQSEKLMRMYSKSHSHVLANFIQLGSTGVFKEPRRHSRENNQYDEGSPRAIAEDEFIQKGGSVLALAGLWGDERVPWNWISKIADTKEKLRGKKALHLIHGWDVARACLCMHKDFYPGDRSIITDGFVYDWWHLVNAWCVDETTTRLTKVPPEVTVRYKEWLSDIGYSGPRPSNDLGRVLNSDAFWKEHGTRPETILTYATKNNRFSENGKDLSPLQRDLNASAIYPHPLGLGDGDVPHSL